MIRRMLVSGVVCASLALNAAAALAAGIDGTGSVATCPAKGKLNLKPALLATPTGAGAIKLGVKSSGACSGGTGDGANIVSFRARGAGTTLANTCTDFNGTSSTDLAVTIRWKVAKGSPRLNPSTATFSLQPGMVAGNGSQTLDLSGTITAGSFVGSHVTAHIESDETAANLLTLCGMKGIKKISFGADDATSSCINGPNLHSAITQQITSIDSNDVPHLLVELTTVTASPFQLTHTGLTYPAGMILEWINSTCAASDGLYRCRHEASFESTGACRWDGDYSLALSYSCNPGNTCDLCSGSAQVGFSLASENFCNSETVFCVPDLTCAETSSRNGSGDTPCCSSTYSPLISCLSANCASVCPAIVNGTGGIDPDDSPCYSCVFNYCHDQYFACSADNQDCFTP